MATSPILRKMVLMPNQHDKIWKWGGEATVSPLQTAVHTEQFGKLQESEGKVDTSPVQKKIKIKGFRDLVICRE